MKDEATINDHSDPAYDASVIDRLHELHAKVEPIISDLEGILERYRRVLVPEINLGQLVRLLRTEYLVDAIGFNKVQGRPFKVTEIAGRCLKLLNGEEVRS